MAGASRVPDAAATGTVTGAVGPKRREHGDRMDPSLPDPLLSASCATALAMPAAPLRHVPCAVALQVRHFTPPFWGSVVGVGKAVVVVCGPDGLRDAGGAAKPHLLDERAAPRGPPSRSRGEPVPLRPTARVGRDRGRGGARRGRTELRSGAPGGFERADLPAPCAGCSTGNRRCSGPAPARSSKDFVAVVACGRMRGVEPHSPKGRSFQEITEPSGGGRLRIQLG